MTGTSLSFVLLTWVFTQMAKDSEFDMVWWCFAIACAVATGFYFSPR